MIMLFLFFCFFTFSVYYQYHVPNFDIYIASMIFRFNMHLYCLFACVYTWSWGTTVYSFVQRTFVESAQRIFMVGGKPSP